MTSASLTTSPNALAPRRVWKTLPRLLAVLLIASMALCVSAYVFRAPLLTSVAKAWVVDDPLTHADAIVIPGGRPDLRATEAAVLYRHRIAPTILYMDVKLSPSAKLGIVPSESEQTRCLLLSNNVPETAITAIGNGVASTCDESRAVGAWIKKSRAKSVLIVTDLSHTRRARWIFRKELRGFGVSIWVHAIRPPEYGVEDWWRHEDGLIAFQNEWIKQVYYWLAH